MHVLQKRHVWCNECILLQESIEFVVESLFRKEDLYSVNLVDKKFLLWKIFQKTEIYEMMLFVFLFFSILMLKKDKKHDKRHQNK